MAYGKVKVERFNLTVRCSGLYCERSFSKRAGHFLIDISPYVWFDAERINLRTTDFDRLSNLDQYSSYAVLSLFKYYSDIRLQLLNVTDAINVGTWAFDDRTLFYKLYGQEDNKAFMIQALLEG